MDLKRLRYFVAVADAGGFTRAAARLNMAQPPLSQRIHELEDEVGVRLFDRQARPLGLTEPGRLFLDQARQILLRVDQLERAMRTVGATERPRLRLAAPAAAFPRPLPEAIRGLRQRLPDLAFSLQEMTSLEQIQALREGRIDLGLGRVRVEDPAVRRMILTQEPLVAVLPADHPLAAEGLEADGAVSLGDLMRNPLVIYPNDARPGFGDHILSLLHDRSLDPVETVEVRDLQTALVLVAAGEAVCVAPEGAGLFAHPGIAFRPLREPLSAPLILSFRSGDANPALAVFVRILAELSGVDPDTIDGFGPDEGDDP